MHRQSDTLHTNIAQHVQIARFFQAANGDNKAAPAAQLSKLKTLLPHSINDWHEALDVLDEQLVSVLTPRLRFLHPPQDLILFPSNWHEMSCGEIWRCVGKRSKERPAMLPT